ncbi:hydroxyacid dehydrogenase [Agromyces sp. SYSU K20354]|uniref:hydroxyacid dehydrogenase n=1 Tax=Agromyces cavernae TaxID=2898659 RepID=UPI001E48F6A8|nr:hydroxyacid dehydrogenase [Agromyces cavernae]MCD2442957.1 hydroxyacid dehydrogenase [Agromyces cavernae]
MSEPVRRRVFPAERIAEFEAVADVAGFLTEFESDASRRVISEVDVLVTGWGAPRIDAAVLAAAPRLEAILHSAGTVKPYLTEEVLARGIRVSSAAAANAAPVAEYTVAMILLANKHVLPIAARYRVLEAEFDVEAEFPLGNYDKRIGIVGASTIGRLVIELLRPYSLEVVVYDPFLDVEEAARLGVRSVGLEELCATSDVVSVHAPSLPSTRGLLDAALIGRMRTGATLVNTSRGEIIDQDALVARVTAGELYAILDVTVPWVLEAGHPFYSSDRVLLTPHIAGSLGTELGRLARSVLDELRRLTDGEELAHRVEVERLAITA